MKDYQQKIIELSAPLNKISKEIAIKNFINGLKPKIKVELRILGPINLGQAMDLAQMTEEKLLIVNNHRSFGKFHGAKSNTSVCYSEAPSSISQAIYDGNFIRTKPTGKTRRLTNSELQKKRGVCVIIAMKNTPRPIIVKGKSLVYYSQMMKRKKIAKL